MIITDANDLVGEAHDRTPVILESGDIDAWLTGGAGTELLKPQPGLFLRLSCDHPMATPMRFWLRMVSISI
jgi:putative SOS response-associated peptidase YedK